MSHPVTYTQPMARILSSFFVGAVTVCCTRILSNHAGSVPKIRKMRPQIQKSSQKYSEKKEAARLPFISEVVVIGTMT